MENEERKYAHGLKITSDKVYLDDRELIVRSLKYEEPDTHVYGLLTVTVYIDRAQLHLEMPPRFDPAQAEIVLCGGERS